jgi:hypothetical protein
MTETPQGSDAAADAAMANVAESGGRGGATGGAPRDPATDGPTWTRGTHYLEQVAVDWRDVRAIDVVAVDLDSSDQEGGLLAKVHQLVETHVALDGLTEPIAEALPADEHGPFRGEVIPPAEGGGTAEIRVTH